MPDILLDSFVESEVHEFTESELHERNTLYTNTDLGPQCAIKRMRAVKRFSGYLPIRNMWAGSYPWSIYSSEIPFDWWQDNTKNLQYPGYGWAGFGDVLYDPGLSEWRSHNRYLKITRYLDGWTLNEPYEAPYSWRSGSFQEEWEVDRATSLIIKYTASDGSNTYTWEVDPDTCIVTETGDWDALEKVSSPKEYVGYIWNPGAVEYSATITPTQYSAAARGRFYVEGDPSEESSYDGSYRIWYLTVTLSNVHTLDECMADTLDILDTMDFPNSASVDFDSDTALWHVGSHTLPWGKEWIKTYGFVSDGNDPPTYAMRLMLAEGGVPFSGDKTVAGKAVFSNSNPGTETDLIDPTGWTFGWESPPEDSNTYSFVQRWSGNGVALKGDCLVWHSADLFVEEFQNMTASTAALEDPDNGNDTQLSGTSYTSTNYGYGSEPSGYENIVNPTDPALSIPYDYWVATFQGACNDARELVLPNASSSAPVSQDNLKASL